MTDETRLPAEALGSSPAAMASPVVARGHQDLVRWGAWIILAGVLLYVADLAFNAFLAFIYEPILASTLTFYAHAILWATAGGVVGLGVFLATLGLARRAPDGNGRWIVGGIFMFVGLLAQSSMQLVVYATVYGGNAFGSDLFLAINVTTAVLGFLLPVGLAIFFFGFLTPEGARPIPEGSPLSPTRD